MFLDTSFSLEIMTGICLLKPQGVYKSKWEWIVGTHLLGFLETHMVPEALEVHGFPWFLVFQLSHQYLEALEGP